MLKGGLRGRPFEFVRGYGQTRGMTIWRDLEDWVGGYPFEVANSGLEIKQGADGFALDRFTLSADRRTVSIHWQNVGTTDQMRIVTTVPEPSSLVLALGAGLALFAVSRCRKREA